MCLGRSWLDPTGVVLVALALACVSAHPVLAQQAQQSDAATRQYAVAVGLQNRKLYELAIEEWQKFLKQFPEKEFKM